MVFLSVAMVSGSIFIMMLMLKFELLHQDFTSLAHHHLLVCCALVHGFLPVLAGAFAFVW